MFNARLTMFNFVLVFDFSKTNKTKNIEKLSVLIQVLTYGCLKDVKNLKILNSNQVQENIWSISCVKGWYYATCL